MSLRSCCPRNNIMREKSHAASRVMSYSMNIAQPTSTRSLNAMNEGPTPIRVYLAAPLFNDLERSFNLRLSDLIAPMAEVFLPQRDGKLMRDRGRDGVPLPVARQRVFEADVNALKRCDCVVAVLDGRTID